MAPTKPIDPFTATLTEELREKYGPFMTIPQVSEAVGYSRRSIGRDIDAGRLKVYRVGRGRVYRIRCEDVAALVVPAN